MAAFKVNGKNVCSEKNQKLLRFLRDELRLTSVKDGNQRRLWDRGMWSLYSDH